MTFLVIRISFGTEVNVFYSTLNPSHVALLPSPLPFSRPLSPFPAALFPTPLSVVEWGESCLPLRVDETEGDVYLFQKKNLSLSLSTPSLSQCRPQQAPLKLTVGRPSGQLRRPAAE